jgi:HK97 family phage portal protein
LIGDLSHTQYGSVEAAQADFIAHTLLPLISMIQDEMNRKLIKPSERASLTIDLDEDHIYLSDKTSTANYLSTLTNAGIMTINEARHIIYLQPVEGGDECRIPYSDANQNLISGNKNNDVE